MILAIHIITALASIVLATVTYFAPTRVKFHLSGSLTVFALASGTYLTISTHTAMLSACTSGLIYLTVISIILVAAHNKLASQTI